MESTRVPDFRLVQGLKNSKSTFLERELPSILARQEESLLLSIIDFQCFGLPSTLSYPLVAKCPSKTSDVHRLSEVVEHAILLKKKCCYNYL